MLDIFRSDAFSAVSLTDGIIKAHYKPGRLGALGLFRSRGINTTTVVIEEKDGRLSLIQTSPRGGPGTTIGAQKRTARSFVVPHLERESTILADEVQNVRAFGSEDALQAVQTLVNERLQDLRAMHEVTLEHLRVGAIQGQVLDADGVTVLFDLFTQFEVSQQTKELDLSGDVRSEVVQAQRLSEYALGGDAVSGYRAFCGDNFFDNLIEAESVKESLKFQESETLRRDLRMGFVYAGVTWENYRGRTGATQEDPEDEASGTPWIADDEAYLVPEGTNIFATYYAPADFIEAVNTVGLPIYAKTVQDQELNRWVKLHSQSNPLAICLRPRAVIKLTQST
jgi:hypothetical protein